MTFVGFPKMGRLTRECVITEKIDGTNAQVFIYPHMLLDGKELVEQVVAIVGSDALLAGSRMRWITPQSDNFGFAAWVRDNAQELAKLGPGQHFGEWWGGKIQRGYGITERRFSLFNTTRWSDAAVRPACCHVVPVLYTGLFGEGAANGAIAKLTHEGSHAAPGFMDPEGIVIYHTAVGTMFKKTIKGDDQPKGRQAA